MAAQSPSVNIFLRSRGRSGKLSLAALRRRQTWWDGTQTAPSGRTPSLSLRSRIAKLFSTGRLAPAGLLGAAQPRNSAGRCPSLDSLRVVDGPAWCRPPALGKAGLRLSARRGSSVAPAVVHARYAPETRPATAGRPPGFAGLGLQKLSSARSPCAPFVPALFRPPWRAPPRRARESETPRRCW